jgi:polyisoprenoid-binding protein YceI
LSTTVQSTQERATGAATWSIDPAHSHVEVAVRHMMVATVKGRFAEVEGTIALDEANPASSTVEARIAAASIDTKQPDRDAHLRSPDFLDAETYPYLTFKSTRVESDRPGTFTLHGDMTIRGVTRPVTFEGEYLGTNTSPYGFRVAGFSASTRINRRDFGLSWNTALETGGVMVSDEVKITLEIEATEQPAR